MTNEQRIIAAAKQHRAGANAHKFNTEFGWKKAGFCPSTGAKAKFTAPQSYHTPKGWLTKEEPIFRDDQVRPISQAPTQEKPKASAPARFCKSVTLKGETVLVYDEAVYAKIEKAIAKAWEYAHRYEKATEERKRDYFKAEVKWYRDHAYEIANAYANA